MRMTWGALLLAVACSQRPSLADRVGERLQEALPGAAVKVEDPGTLKITVKPDGGEYVLSLDNLRLQCAKGAEACEQGIDATVGNVVHNEKTAVEEAQRMSLAHVRLT